MILNIRIYLNGMCIVFDENGKQIPELQGPFGEAAPLISKALHEQTVNAGIYFSEWLGASLGTITLESFDRLWKRGKDSP